ncbi:MAG: hypothetical protein ACREOQ_06295 [Gemmatimonadales bacterium]
MAKLTRAWTYIPPGQALFCQESVTGLDRRRAPRAAGEALRARRCSWFFLGVWRRSGVQIRIVGDRSPRVPASAHGILVRCACGTWYEMYDSPAS